MSIPDECRSTTTSGAGPDAARPWERPGALRRDCEPHRGPVLGALGLAACLGGLFSLLLGAPGVFGITLGVAVRQMARRDLGLMRAGLMDRAGEVDTDQARRCSAVGVALGACGLALHAGVFLLFWAGIGSRMILLVLSVGVLASLILFVDLVCAVVIRRTPPR